MSVRLEYLVGPATDIRIAQEAKRKGGRPSIYPWHEWMDGDWHELPETGIGVTMERFRGVLYTRARRCEQRVETHVDRERKVIRFRFMQEE